LDGRVEIEWKEGVEKVAEIEREVLRSAAASQEAFKDMKERLLVRKSAMLRLQKTMPLAPP
jgi:hypothetical protein